MIPVLVPVISHMSRVHDSLTRQSLLDEWYGFKCYTHNMSYQCLRHKLHRHIQAERERKKPSTPSNRYIKYWDQSKAYQALLGGPITRVNRTVFEQGMLGFP